ncbi:protein phosphatase regulator [Tieghemiomyces parasiticus]|uniref:Protein phosphatase regulator n=1 Tax=Tieghemiomyces parasiticus TaxID=78921 RepID=A0A9W8A9U5_9FUNG|nr:protein phosphatase regulator [Tieghemiomyces parasiticus]
MSTDDLFMQRLQHVGGQQEPSPNPEMEAYGANQGAPPDPSPPPQFSINDSFSAQYQKAQERSSDGQTLVTTIHTSCAHIVTSETGTEIQTNVTLPDGQMISLNAGQIPTIVYAAFDFVRMVDGQVTVRESEELMLLDESNQFWWLVLKDTGDIGYIPADNIETRELKQARINRDLNVEAVKQIDRDRPLPVTLRPSAKKARGITGIQFSENIITSVNETYHLEDYIDYDEEGNEIPHEDDRLQGPHDPDGDADELTDEDEGFSADHRISAARRGPTSNSSPYAPGGDGETTLAADRDGDESPLNELNAEANLALSNANLGYGSTGYAGIDRGDSVTYPPHSEHNRQDTDGLDFNRIYELEPAEDGSVAAPGRPSHPPGQSPNAFASSNVADPDAEPPFEFPVAYHVEADPSDPTDYVVASEQIVSMNLDERFGDILMRVLGLLGVPVTDAAAYQRYRLLAYIEGFQFGISLENEEHLYTLLEYATECTEGAPPEECLRFILKEDPNAVPTVATADPETGVERDGRSRSTVSSPLLDGADVMANAPPVSNPESPTLHSADQPYFGESTSFLADPRASSPDRRTPQSPDASPFITEDSVMETMNRITEHLPFDPHAPTPERRLGHERSPGESRRSVFDEAFGLDDLAEEDECGRNKALPSDDVGSPASKPLPTRPDSALSNRSRSASNDSMAQGNTNPGGYVSSPPHGAPARVAMAAMKSPPRPPRPPPPPPLDLDRPVSSSESSSGDEVFVSPPTSHRGKPLPQPATEAPVRSRSPTAEDADHSPDSSVYDSADSSPVEYGTPITGYATPEIAVRTETLGLTTTASTGVAGPRKMPRPASSQGPPPSRAPLRPAGESTSTAQPIPPSRPPPPPPTGLLSLENYSVTVTEPDTPASPEKPIPRPPRRHRGSSATTMESDASSTATDPDRVLKSIFSSILPPSSPPPSSQPPSAAASAAPLPTDSSLTPSATRPRASSGAGESKRARPQLSLHFPPPPDHSPPTHALTNDPEGSRLPSPRGPTAAVPTMIRTEPVVVGVTRSGSTASRSSVILLSPSLSVDQYGDDSIVYNPLLHDGLARASVDLAPYQPKADEEIKRRISYRDDIAQEVQHLSEGMPQADAHADSSSGSPATSACDQGHQQLPSFSGAAFENSSMHIGDGTRLSQIGTSFLNASEFYNEPSKRTSQAGTSFLNASEFYSEPGKRMSQMGTSFLNASEFYNEPGNAASPSPSFMLDSSILGTPLLPSPSAVAPPASSGSAPISATAAAAASTAARKKANRISWNAVMAVNEQASRRFSTQQGHESNPTSPIANQKPPLSRAQSQPASHRYSRSENDSAAMVAAAAAAVDTATGTVALHRVNSGRRNLPIARSATVERVRDSMASADPLPTSSCDTLISPSVGGLSAAAALGGLSTPMTDPGTYDGHGVVTAQLQARDPVAAATSTPRQTTDTPREAEFPSPRSLPGRPSSQDTTGNESDTSFGTAVTASPEARRAMDHSVSTTAGGTGAGGRMMVRAHPATPLPSLDLTSWLTLIRGMQPLPDDHLLSAGRGPFYAPLLVASTIPDEQAPQRMRRPSTVVLGGGETSRELSGNPAATAARPADLTVTLQGPINEDMMLDYLARFPNPKDPHQTSPTDGAEISDTNQRGAGPHTYHDPYDQILSKIASSSATSLPVISTSETTRPGDDDGAVAGGTVTTTTTTTVLHTSEPFGLAAESTGKQASAALESFFSLSKSVSERIEKIERELDDLVVHVVRAF